MPPAVMPQGACKKQVQFFYYSCSGAPTGQTEAQAPHSRQASASITYEESPSEMQLTGHSEAQAPQLMQASLILYAIRTHLLLKSCLYTPIKRDYFKQINFCFNRYYITFFLNIQGFLKFIHYFFCSVCFVRLSRRFKGVTSLTLKS